MLLLLSACRDLTKPEIKTPDSPRKSLSSVGSIVVYADSMRGWTFYDDQHSIACTTSTVCSMVLGPSGQPPGSGSAQLGTVATSDGNALIYAGYGGTRLDHITSLSYSTYRQSADAGNNLAIALQFNADFDLSDAAVGYQGRIVYEPYMTTGGQVTGGVWQSWNARTGKWWSTKASVTRNGVATTNPCVQSAPCTWTQLLARFPNLGIHATYGAIVLKAGSGWANFRGNVDKLTIGLDSTETTYDFEVTAPATAKHVLSVLADPGVSGTPAQGDSAYPMGTVVPYVFHGAGDGGVIKVYLDGQIVPDSGTVQMNAEHALIVALSEDLTLRPEDQQMYSAIRAVLLAGNPAGRYQQLLDLASQLAADNSDAFDGIMRRATAAAIDIQQDSAALQRIDSLLGGQVFDVNVPEESVPPGGGGGGDPVYRGRKPGEGQRLAPSRSLTPTVPRADPTTFMYVNGIGNLYADAVATAAKLGVLLRRDDPEHQEFKNTSDVRIQHVYNRNDYTQRQSEAAQIRCMRLLDYGAQGVVDYQRCLRKGALGGIFSLANDLTELKQLLVSTGPITGPAADDIERLAVAINFEQQVAGRNVVIMSHSEGNVIALKGLDSLSHHFGFTRNASPVCAAVAPMASPVTSYPPLGAAYVKPSQLEGDIIQIVPYGVPAANTFPATPNALNDSLRLSQSLLGFEPAGLQLFRAYRMHAMSAYLSPTGGRSLLRTALNDAYTACAIAEVSVASPSMDSLKVGATRQFTAFTFNGAGDAVLNPIVMWSAVDGLTVNSSGLATAVKPTDTWVEARVRIKSGYGGVHTWSSPPNVSAFSCIQGDPIYDVFTQRRTYTVHANAVPSVPYAQVVNYTFDMEMQYDQPYAGPSAPKSWSDFFTHSSAADPNGSLTITVATPYFGGPVSTGQWQPTGLCRLRVTDSFGKTTTEFTNF